MKLALLGTGLMGFPMARRLLNAGHHLSVWNRTKLKAAPLGKLGADVADSAAEAVSGANIVFVVLENGRVVSDVLFHQGVVGAVSEGTLFVDNSSIAPEQARENATQMMAENNCIYLDAPVSGGPDGATDGRLAIMVGGPPQGYEQARSFLEILGRPTHVGDAGAGQFAKLSSQLILSNTMSAVAETLLFSRAQGVDPLKIIEALSGGYADSRVLQYHGRKMIDRDFHPGGHVHTFVKDLRAAHRWADAEKLYLPACSLAFQRFQDLEKRGHAGSDISSIALKVEAENQGWEIDSNPARFPGASV